jgi:hypothetical protein
VRKVVLTLTSKSAEIYLSMAGAKQLGDTGFILVLVRAVRTAVVCSGHCIALHHSACRGGYKRGGRGGRASRSQRFLIEASVNIVVKAESVRASAIRPLFCGQGTAPPFIAKEEAVYRRVTLFYLRVMA